MNGIDYRQPVKEAVNIVKQNSPKGAKNNLFLIAFSDEKITCFRGLGVNLVHYVHQLLHGAGLSADSTPRARFFPAFNAIFYEYMNVFELYRFVIVEFYFRVIGVRRGSEANGERRNFGSPFGVLLHWWEITSKLGGKNPQIRGWYA